MQAAIIVTFVSILNHCELVQIHHVGSAVILVLTEPTLRHLPKPLERKVSPSLPLEQIEKACIKWLASIKKHAMYL